MSNPKAGRGRSVSPSHSKRSKSVKNRKPSSGRSSKETATEKTRSRSKSRHRDERGNRGRSKSVHNRTRSRSKSVHQKNSSGRKKETRSRSKSVHRKNSSHHKSKRRVDPQHQQHSEDDYSDAEEHRQAAPIINRRASLARQPSVRMRRSKSMSLGVNPLEPDDDGKSRRARRRMSSFGDEGAGRPTLSKELQKRRSVRRLQVEEIKSQERLQNSVFEKALQRNRSSRMLLVDDNNDDEEEDQQPAPTRRAGRRPTLEHTSCSNRRSSMDVRSASMKKSVSRRRLSMSDDNDEPIRSRRGGSRRASMEHNVATWKRASSSRRVMADDINEDTNNDNNTRRKKRTIKRSITMESDRPSNNSFKDPPSSMKRATSFDGAEGFEPLQRISRSNRRASMDVAVKKASSSRRLSTAASKKDIYQDEDKLDKEESMNFFGDFETDEDFFKAGAGIKAISIEGAVEDKDTEKAFKVLAKAENAAKMIRKASGRKLVVPENEEEPEQDDSSASEEEASMTEFTEDQSELQMADMSESVVEAQPARRTLTSKADSKRIALEKAASSRRSLRHLMEPEDTDVETDDDEVTISSRLPPKLDSKSAFLQKAAQGKALLDMAKSSKKYNLEDSSVASDLHSQSTADASAASMRIRRRGSGLGTGPPPRRASGRRTSLGLMKIGKMDESHTTCQSSHTQSTVGTSASSSTSSTLSRSSASQRSSSSAESQAQRMKDFGSRYRSSKKQSS